VKTIATLAVAASANFEVERTVDTTKILKWCSKAKWKSEGELKVKKCSRGKRMEELEGM